MIDMLVRHLLDSTLFCLLLGGVAATLSAQRAAARHLLWLIGVCKFAVPTTLLTATGEQIAFALPAGDTLSVLAGHISAFLSFTLSWLPSPGHITTSNMASFLLCVIWGFGTATMLARWRKGSWGEHGMTYGSSYEQDLLEEARKELSIISPVSLYSSKRIAEPVLLGVFRPRICLPAELSLRLSSAELKAVLLHELAHLKRHDNLTGTIVRLLICVFWFHPLLWYGQMRLLIERERACDQLVVTHGITAKTYIAGIFKICGFRLFEPISGISRMSGSDLKKRLELILSKSRSPKTDNLIHLLLATAILFAALLPIAGGYCDQCVSNGQAKSNAEAVCGSATAAQHPCKQ